MLGPGRELLTCFSLSLSRAEVASSSSRMGGSFRIARAMATRCVHPVCWAAAAAATAIQATGTAVPSKVGPGYASGPVLSIPVLSIPMVLGLKEGHRNDHGNNRLAPRNTETRATVRARKFMEIGL